MDEIQIPISFPLDSDGFLRRACPNCGYEFKWLPTEGDEQPSSPENYFCPYCGKPAPPGEWFTEEQVEYMRAKAVDAAFEVVLRPSIDDLAESFEQLGRASGGLFQFTTKVEKPTSQQAPPVFEPNDMKRIDFVCHPSEPIKVSEMWDGLVHCLCCGSISDATQ